MFNSCGNTHDVRDNPQFWYLWGESERSENFLYCWMRLQGEILADDRFSVALCGSTMNGTPLPQSGRLCPFYLEPLMTGNTHQIQLAMESLSKPRSNRKLPRQSIWVQHRSGATYLFSVPADFFWQTMTAGAYFPVYSVLCLTSQMEELLALTPTMLTPFLTLALLETGSAWLR